VEWNVESQLVMANFNILLYWFGRYSHKLVGVPSAFFAERNELADQKRHRANAYHGQNQHRGHVFLLAKSMPCFRHRTQTN